MLLNLETAEAVCCESDGPYSYGPTLENDKAAIEALFKYDTYNSLFDGLRTMNSVKILWGSLLSAFLAVSINYVLKLFEEFGRKSHVDKNG